MGEDTGLEGAEIFRYLKVIANSQSSEDRQLVVSGGEAAEEAMRRLLHDYQAALRVFRFLAEKDLRSSDASEALFEKKRLSIRRHENALETVQKVLTKILV